MYLYFRSIILKITCLLLLVNTLSFVVAQDQTDNQNEQFVKKNETLSSAPCAVPVLTLEEAYLANQEAIQLRDEMLANKTKQISSDRDKWRRDNNRRFLLHSILLLVCLTIVSNLACLVLNRKKTQKRDLAKATVSTFSSFALLFLLYSIIPYFYSFWSVANICLIGFVDYLFIKYFEKIFYIQKKDIILIPFLAACAILFVHYANPRMRDIPNTIVLLTEARGLIYNGVVCNNNQAKTKKDFFSSYKHITFDEGWRQYRSYGAILHKKGKLTLHIPTELIETYDLCVELYVKDKEKLTEGIIIYNDADETQWKMSKRTFLIPLKSDYLYTNKKNSSPLHFAVCLVGAFVLVLIVARLIENSLILYFQSNQYAYSLLFLLVCAICFAVCIKEILFVDVSPDLDDFGSYVFPSECSSCRPAITCVWWKIAIFLSPLESWNASFALCTLCAFYTGLFLVGNSLIKKGCTICPYLLVFSSFNIICTRFYPSLRADQIVASHCVLAFGLCVFASNKRKLNKFILFLTLAYLTFIISLVRGEALSCAVPILIVFFSLSVFQSLRGWKRIIFSGLLGSIAAVILFCSYRFILSPYVIHEAPFDNSYSIIDNYFREALGVCYFSKDWDDLPEWYTKKAADALDKTRFIERPHDYRMEYLPNVTKEEILVFWFHMVKKHPWTYLKVKWVGNQVLWRLRSPFAIPREVQLDNDPTETGLSLHNFFKEGLSTCGIVMPSWLPQVSLFFLFVFTSLLLLKFNDSLLWIIWGIGASGFLHNFAFFLISAAPNYRYIFWADISGCISFFLACLVVGKFIEWLRLKHNHNNQSDSEDNNETVCTDTLFQ